MTPQREDPLFQRLQNCLVNGGIGGLIRATLIIADAAAAQGNEEPAQILNRERVLHFAASAGDLKVIALAFLLGADIDLVDDLMGRPMDVSISEDQQTASIMLALFGASIANPPTPRDSPIEKAVWIGPAFALALVMASSRATQTSPQVALSAIENQTLDAHPQLRKVFEMLGLFQKDKGTGCNGSDVE